ncbi:disulfide-isomerase-like 2 [Homarus americanus]|uniref:Disulfide-isomerase-like 2 n=1 Tax=Homarus americanus TaxID=6706 RepID=A0A8J5JHU5_HOMAM|nr:disulfide-isomerase-like 2 [Homarus americanus]
MGDIDVPELILIDALLFDLLDEIIPPVKYSEINKRSCKDCDKVLSELETIDDDTDRFGVHFVKVADKKLAKSYGIKIFPALSFFRNKEPIHYEGDLMDEGSVLEFLTSLEAMELPDQIEEVNAKILDKIVEEQEFVAVLFCYDGDACNQGEHKAECRRCVKALQELENVDDDADQLGIAFVKINDPELADEYSLGALPALVYYRRRIPVVYDDDRDESDDTQILQELENIDDELDAQGIHIVKIADDIPSLYDGDLHNEDEVLAWLIQQLHTDEIEDITDEMLDKLIRESNHLAVLFYDEDDQDSQLVVNELENIDDECDSKGVSFVKIDNDDEAKEYGIDTLPTLVYFEKGIPSVYSGNLLAEDEVLDWLVHQVDDDEIEDVTDEMLDRLIDRSEHLAVLFYDKDSRRSRKVLAELENIDDECDTRGIYFVKIDNYEEAKEYGIDRIPTLVYFESEIPYIFEDDKDDAEDHEVLAELESIDDDCEQAGVPFVKIDNDAEAKEYGIEDLPTLVYFENRIPSIYEGDLSNEQEVLAWLLKQKNTDTIEEVTDEILDDLIANFEYVVVYFSGKCDQGQKCDRILNELENIDDDTDEHGMHFVTTEETTLAHEHGIKVFPALVLFRNGDPVFYKGEISDEDAVLQWLTAEDTLEIPNQIEEVNQRMLERILNTSDNVAVFFYTENDKKSRKILTELENIDDECDDIGIDFVKISDDGIAQEYDIVSLPALVYFRNRFPQIYEGDLKDEEALLEWLIDNKDKGPASIIEEVDGQMLQNLVDTFEYLVVYFYDDNCPTCETVLAELETIDDETDEVGIQFVKTNDVEVAEDLGISHLPALVYFEGGVPSIYDVNEENDECPKVLRVLEKIDDEAAEYGIQMVKMNDRLMAKKYGYRNPPGLVYFRKAKHIKYDGDLYDEEDVLDWLTAPENMELNDAIEKVNRKMFERIKQSTDYLAVFFYAEEGCKQCQKVLAELENIDDEADANGIDFVKIDDSQLAKEVGVYALPAIVFYRAGTEDPIIYAGDMKNEENLLSWLLTEKDPTADFIEDMEGAALLHVIRDSDAIAVYFYTEDSSCATCKKVLEELENIDDDTDRIGVSFVKTQDMKVAERYGVTSLPALLYFEHQIPTVYEGDLLAEEDVLQWLVLQKTEDTIETNIDDECDLYGIHMVKIQDAQLAKRYGIKTLPALIYFRNGNPLIFDDNILDEEEVVEWLISEDNRDLEDTIEEINDVMLRQILPNTSLMAVLFMSKPVTCCASSLSQAHPPPNLVFIFSPSSPVLSLQWLLIDLNDLLSVGTGVYDWLIDDDNRKLEGNIEEVNAIMFEAILSSRLYLAGLFMSEIKDGKFLLDWLSDDENRELVDEIEHVNPAMLDQLVAQSTYLAALFYEDDCPDCEQVLQELENIDDEVDMFGIDFVKINDPDAAHRFNILHTPALVYFRKKMPLVYDGDLLDEEKVFKWLTSQDVFEIKDEIEEVNRKMLEKLLDENDFVAVYFWDLSVEEEVLDWLQKNRFKHPELNLFMYATGAITLAFIMYTLFLIFCFRSPAHQKAA